MAMAAAVAAAARCSGADAGSFAGPRVAVAVAVASDVAAAAAAAEGEEGGEGEQSTCGPTREHHARQFSHKRGQGIFQLYINRESTAVSVKLSDITNR